MAALILPLISNKNGAVYDSTVGVISRLLQSDVAKAGDPQRATEILVRVVKREHLPRVHRITRSLKNAALRTFTQALLSQQAIANESEHRHDDSVKYAALAMLVIAISNDKS
jgi:hypothetical protein